LISEGEWKAEELETRKNLLDILKINHNSADPINETVLQKVLEKSGKLLEESCGKLLEEKGKLLEQSCEKLLEEFRVKLLKEIQTK
jgi:hypothetical protein